MKENFKQSIIGKLAAAKLAEHRRETVVNNDVGLLDFIVRINPKYSRPVHLSEAVPELEKVLVGKARLLLSAPPRHGKAIADDERILTKNGWKLVGDVVVGDELVGSNGRWTNVTGVFPQGEVPLYRVKFSDGTSVRTCADHRWSVTNRDRKGSQVKTTSELAGDLLASDGRRKWQIPVVEPLSGHHDPLLIEPYLLGVWLGDGTSKRGEITSMDPEIVQAILDAGFGLSYVYETGRAKTYGVPKLVTALRAVGVLGNKHIPQSYLQADVESRLALLQGLGDTDGTVAANGSQQSICTTSEVLAADIKQLICSLGGVYTEQRKVAAGKVAHNIAFRLRETMAGFRLARKQSRLSAPSAKNRPRRFVASITPARRARATCFTVAADDSLFCVGRDFIVSHNTDSIAHLIALYIARDPTRKVAFISYSASLSENKSTIIRDYAVRAGVEMSAAKKGASEWMTRANGGLDAVGVGGALTGKGYNLIVIDDPIRNRGDAESQLLRDKTFDFYTSTARSRLEPGGSVIVTHTRWHDDDLIGRLSSQKKAGWTIVNLPAINSEGIPLWPERFTVADFEEIREDNEYDWASLYMGQPRPKGGAVFQGCATYDELPTDVACRAESIGVDLAYTAKTYSDYSVCITGKKYGDKIYITDVRRAQTPTTEFGRTILAAQMNAPRATPFWFTGGIEQGIVNMLRSQGVYIKSAPAKTDKFVRAQPVAAAWNRGDILVPSDHERFPWVNAFLNEILAFTGVGDKRDDQVDALAAMYEPIRAGTGNVGMRSERILPF